MDSISCMAFSTMHILNNYNFFKKYLYNFRNVTPTNIVAFFQKLRPTDIPIFEIKNLLINETGTQLALWGNLGLVLMELPKRWGKDGMFQGGKEEILCM